MESRDRLQKGGTDAKIEHSMLAAFLNTVHKPKAVQEPAMNLCQKNRVFSKYGFTGSFNSDRATIIAPKH